MIKNRLAPNSWFLQVGDRVRDDKGHQGTIISLNGGPWGYRVRWDHFKGWASVDVGDLDIANGLEVILKLL